ncbi:MAG TPA: hypothetical protein VF808_00655 [Ktedonobacterales bacterium]
MSRAVFNGGFEQALNLVGVFVNVMSSAPFMAREWFDPKSLWLGERGQSTDER